MKTKHNILRYLIITPFIGLADFGVYYLCIRFLPHFVSKAISYIVANGIGYLFNKYWVFKKKQTSYPEVGRYVAVDLVLFGCNVLINQIILIVSHHAVFLSIATASLITMLLSFACKKWWVFK